MHISKSFGSVFFDLDGTLTDPKEGITNSYLYALDKLGLNEVEPDIISGYMGASLHTYFAARHNVAKENLEEAVKLYRDYFSTFGLYENKLYPGIPELLTSIVQKGMNNFLVTSKPTVYSKQILEHFELNKLFKGVYGSDLTVQNKSKEILIAETIKSEKLHKEDLIMVGDREFDIIGAKLNGIDSAAVTYGYGSLSELINSEPDYIITSVEELKELLLNEKHKH